MTVPAPQPESNSLKAIIRSLMPFVYSTAASLIAHLGYHVSMKSTVEIVAIVGAALTILLHALETQWPAIGIFLGYVGAPVYAPSTKVSQAQQIAQLEAQIASLVASNEEKATPSTPSDGNAAPPVTT